VIPEPENRAKGQTAAEGSQSLSPCCSVTTRELFPGHRDPIPRLEFSLEGRVPVVSADPLGHSSTKREMEEWSLDRAHNTICLRDGFLAMPLILEGRKAIPDEPHYPHGETIGIPKPCAVHHRLSAYSKCNRVLGSRRQGPIQFLPHFGGGDLVSVQMKNPLMLQISMLHRPVPLLSETSESVAYDSRPGGLS